MRTLFRNKKHPLTVFFPVLRDGPAKPLRSNAEQHAVLPMTTSGSGAERRRRSAGFRLEHCLGQCFVFLPVDAAVPSPASPPVFFDDHGLLLALQLVEVAVGARQISIGNVIAAAKHL